MRTILKILVAPFMVILTVLWAFITFLFCWAKAIVELASGLVMILAIIMFLIGVPVGGIVFTIIAFLMSPLGLPAIAEWLVDKLGDLKESLIDFVTT